MVVADDGKVVWLVGLRGRSYMSSRLLSYQYRFQFKGM